MKIVYIGDSPIERAYRRIAKQNGSCAFRGPSDRLYYTKPTTPPPRAIWALRRPRLDSPSGITGPGCFGKQQATCAAATNV